MLEFVILLIFGVLIALLILATYLIAKKEDRGIITSLISIFGLIGFEMFIYIPSIQFLILGCILVLMLFIVSKYLLPRLFHYSEMFLFSEQKPEIWESLRVSTTIIEKEENED